MPVPLEPPRRAEDGSVAYDLEGRTVRLERGAGGWRYERPGLPRPLHLPGGDAPPALAFGARIVPETVLLRFPAPRVVPPRAELELWLALPLEVVVVLGDPPTGHDWPELDALRPSLRSALFGPIDQGRLHPAADAVVVDGPGSADLAGRPAAALRLRITSRSPRPVAVPRVPVDGLGLRLFRKGASLAAGDVELVLLDAVAAEGRSLAGRAPKGFEAVREPRDKRREPLRLAWLVDSTRRSMEFTL